MNYNWCRAKLRLPEFNLWPEEKSSRSNRKQMKETAGSRLKDRGLDVDWGGAGREGSRRECTNDAQDLSRTYGLFRRPLSAQREGGRSIYAKQSASYIIYMHSHVDEGVAICGHDACAPQDAECLRIYVCSPKRMNAKDYFNIKASAVWHTHAHAKLDRHASY